MRMCFDFEINNWSMGVSVHYDIIPGDKSVGLKDEVEIAEIVVDEVVTNCDCCYNWDRLQRSPSWYKWLVDIATALVEDYHSDLLEAKYE